MVSNIVAKQKEKIEDSVPLKIIIVLLVSIIWENMLKIIMHSEELFQKAVFLES